MMTFNGCMVPPNPAFTTYKSVSGDYTILTTDSTINLLSGGITILPSAVNLTSRVFNIKNSGTLNVTLSTTLAQTIDSYSTITLFTQENLTVQSTGTNWIIL